MEVARKMLAVRDDLLNGVIAWLDHDALNPRLKTATRNLEDYVKFKLGQKLSAQLLRRNSNAGIEGVEGTSSVIASCVGAVIHEDPVYNRLLKQLCPGGVRGYCGPFPAQKSVERPSPPILMHDQRFCCFQLDYVGMNTDFAAITEAFLQTIRETLLRGAWDAIPGSKRYEFGNLIAVTDEPPTVRGPSQAAIESDEFVRAGVRYLEMQRTGEEPTRVSGRMRLLDEDQQAAVVRYFEALLSPAEIARMNSIKKS